MSQGPKTKAGGGADVQAKCPVDGCAKPGVRVNFCQLHFLWFKEGLITRQGLKPTDFDRKYQAYLNRQNSTPKKATVA